VHGANRRSSKIARNGISLLSYLSSPEFEVWDLDNESSALNKPKNKSLKKINMMFGMRKREVK
jgi:hypothetical protein